MNLKYGTIGFLGVIIMGSLMLSQMGMTEGMESDAVTTADTLADEKKAAPSETNVKAKSKK